MSPPKRKQELGRLGTVNVLVCGLIVVAVVAGGIGGWVRYSRKSQSAQGGALCPALVGTGGGMVQVAGLPQGLSVAPTCRFVCPQCGSSCWTQARSGRLACPFCGLAMVQQGINQQGGNIALAAGVATAGTTSANAAVSGGTTWSIPMSIPIQADAVSLHANRGACTDCHAIIKPTAPVLVRPHIVRGLCTSCHKSIKSNTPAASPGQGTAATAQGAPKTMWQGVAAPPIPPNAVKPTLVPVFGMEVVPVSGGLKVTGVMGNSYASRAGVKTGDMVIGCNGAKVSDLAQFQAAVNKSAPESNANVTFMRDGRTKDVPIMVGEGEMEGFTPIKR